MYLVIFYHHISFPPQSLCCLSLLSTLLPRIERRRMTTSRRSLWLVVGALSGCSSVAAGSAGSHILPKRADDEHYIKLWNTAVQYHQLHSIALCICPFVSAPFSNIAGTLFLGGEEREDTIATHTHITFEKISIQRD